MRAAFDALSDGFAIFDEQSRLRLFNRRYLELYDPASRRWYPGISLEEVARDTARYCLGIREEHAVEAFVRNRLRAHASPGTYIEQEFANGCWLRLHEVRLPNGHTAGIRTEITELKRVGLELAQLNGSLERRVEERTRALRERESTLRLITDNVPVVLASVCADQRYQFVNRRFSEWYGLAPREVLGKTIREVLGEDDYLLVQPYITRALAGETVSFEFKRTLTGKGPRWISASYVPHLDDHGGVCGIYGLLSDITEARSLAEELSYHASHDPLTGLINRRELERRLDGLLAQRNGSSHALFYLDLDQFKVINDTCGRSAGDDLLRVLADLLRQSLRADDSIARLGGDEFAVLLKGCSMARAIEIAEQLREKSAR